MSYQPVPPAPGMPVMPYGAAPAPAPMPPARRKGLVVLGALLLVGGLIGGGVLVMLANSTRQQTVEKFARAPLGCTTTLQFDKAATFTFFLETKGRTPSLGGDCSGSDQTYERGDDDPPDVTLSLIDDVDAQLGLTPSTRYSYDTGDYKGSAIQEVRIDRPGTYRLTVRADSSADFAIAVGGDPDADALMMQMAGGGVALVGLLVGAVLLIIGSKKRTPPVPTQAVPSAAPGWPPQSAAPPVATPTYPGSAPAPAAPATPWYPAAPVTPPAPPVAPHPPEPPHTPEPPPPPPAGPGWGAPHP